MTSVHDVLPFTVHGQRFAIPAREAVRVFPALALQTLPEAPAVVAGISVVHGRVLPVADLCARLGWPSLTLHPWHHWIWLRTARRELLLPVERTEPVRRLHGALHAVDTVDGALVRGVLGSEDGLYLLHDMDAFLTQEDARHLDAALAQHAGH